MEIPFDILDYIFSLLKSYPESLIACSKSHRTFSRIVERHRYFHIIIHTGTTKVTYSFEPSYLTKLLSEMPRISDYVRILQIEFHKYKPAEITPHLEEIASILPTFPGLECIMLTTLGCTLSWYNFSQRFRRAVADCLHLPTLQEVHVGHMDFPLSMLDNHTNIKCFSLSGWPQREIHGYTDTPYPQLKSLSVDGFHDPFSSFQFHSWAKQHIVKLQSLKYDYSNDQTFLSLLEICSDTLNNLDLTLQRYISDYFEEQLHHTATS